MSQTTLDPTQGLADSASQREQPDLEKQSPLEGQSPARPANNETSSPDDSPTKHDPQYEVSWDGPSDPTFPQNFPIWRKWSQVLITSSTSLCVTCTSSLYTSTYSQLEEEFHCSRIVATLGLSLFVAGLGLSPLVLGPLSEFYGRKPVYIVSMLFFLIWLIPCAAAHNIETMLIGRFFNGFAGAAFLTVAGGTVGDLFDKMSLQAPMLIFTSSPFLGPVVGPIVGG